MKNEKQKISGIEVWFTQKLRERKQRKRITKQLDEMYEGVKVNPAFAKSVC